MKVLRYIFTKTKTHVKQNARIKTNKQSYLGDTADLVPCHCNKANYCNKASQMSFWFLSACKSYVYTTLSSVKWAVALSKINAHTLITHFIAKNANHYLSFQ